MVAPGSNCPLCRESAAQFYHRDKFRSYYQCARCALVFVPPAYFLSPAEEKDYYDLHENALEDDGYRRFLNRCAQPLVSILPDGARGLDFGCGPAPLLAKILEEQGCKVSLYDHFYQPDTGVFSAQYDFVVSTEVIEHLWDPRSVLERLWDSIRPGGVLALMTKLVLSKERFASWHYIRDPTHIVFFSESTFHWFAEYLGARLEFPAADVIFLHKPVSVPR